jgi:hypothetical protein
MIKIEIASYPKSGNTWFRHIAQNFLDKLRGDSGFEIPPDIHQGVVGVKNYNALFINEIGDNVLIYKSHIFNHPKVNPEKIIHIYRHPLDIFLSARNFFYHQSHKINQDRLEELFIDGKPKSVEEIVENQEMDYYFCQFLEQAGSTYWPGMLGDKSNYFKYVFHALESDNTISIKYENLLHDVSDVANKTFRYVFGNIPYIPVDTDEIQKKTKHSKNTKFFWKAVANNYKNFLTEEQITLFNKKYNDELSALGYTY